MRDFKSAPKLISFANRQTEVGGGDTSVTRRGGGGGGGRSEFFVCFASLWCMFGVPCPWCVCVCDREFVRACVFHKCKPSKML